MTGDFSANRTSLIPTESRPLTLPRTPEPDPINLRDDAVQYEAMDHTEVNRGFVDDLIAGGDVGPRIIDIGCGPAKIPIEICQRDDQWTVMAIDSSIEMLEIARMQIDFAGMLDRIFLEHAEVADLSQFEEGMANTVVCNSLIHHLPDPMLGLRMAVRLVGESGRVFIRDLVRPASEDEVERLVEIHASGESEYAQQLFRQSLHAALTLDEIREMSSGLGIGEDNVQMSSDRHWTIDWLRPPDREGSE